MVSGKKIPGVIFVKDENDMNKKILAVWFVLLIILFFFLKSGFTSVRVMRFSETQETKVRELTDWKVSSSGQKDENGNYISTYTIRVPLIHNSSETMMFYTTHSDVSVYVEKERIYTVSTNLSENTFQAVRSNRWDQFSVEKAYEGKRLRVVLKTPYKSVAERAPLFLLGNELDIVIMELKAALLSIFLAFAVFACGIAMCIYYVFSGKSRLKNYRTIYLGIFSAFIGFWFLINIPIVQFLIGNYMMLEYISYLIFGMLPIPFILFEKQIVAQKFGWLLSLIAVYIMLVQTGRVVLQMTGYMDLKVSQTIIHVVILLSIVMFILLGIVNMYVNRESEKSLISRVNVIFLLVIAAGSGIDILTYYIYPQGGKEFNCSKFALLLYIVSLVYATMKETEELVQKAQDAERLAYTDELTGLNNRTAYNEAVEKIDLTKGVHTVFMCDLNNLKKCNDTMGHHWGDTYIKISAGIIQESFDDIGRAYRIGGDEFCIISDVDDPEQIQAAYDKLAYRVEEYNTGTSVIEIGIAVGYARYDANIDKNLEDTRIRADQRMYLNKEMIKNKKIEKSIDKCQYYCYNTACVSTNVDKPS